jgi:hypothetical protein
MCGVIDGDGEKVVCLVVVVCRVRVCGGDELFPSS